MSIGPCSADNSRLFRREALGFQFSGDVGNKIQTICLTPIEPHDAVVTAQPDNGMVWPEAARIPS